MLPSPPGADPALPRLLFRLGPPAPPPPLGARGPPAGRGAAVGTGSGWCMGEVRYQRERESERERE